jgi:esterase/lipase
VSPKKPPSDPKDFCVIDTPKESRLSHFEWLSLHGGKELSKAVDWIAKQFQTFTVSHSSHEISTKTFEEARDFYSEFSFGDHVEPTRKNFFVLPETLSKSEVTTRVIHGLAEGEVLDGYFVSKYNPHREELVEELIGAHENRHVRFRLWKRDNAKGTVVAIHGWTMGDQRINSLAFLPGKLFLAGYNVILPELPFHGRRARKARGPAFFPSANPFFTNEGMGQAISDIRALLGYLESEKFPKIGVIGFSLGAYVASLLSGIESKLFFSIPLLPLVSMSESAWNYVTKSPQFEDLKRSGLTHDIISQVYQVHSPLSYSLNVPKERVMIVGGLGDEMVPARQTKLLHQHWGKPSLTWLDGGHAAHLNQTRGMEVVLEALDSWC